MYKQSHKIGEQEIGRKQERDSDGILRGKEKPIKSTQFATQKAAIRFLYAW